MSAAPWWRRAFRRVTWATRRRAARIARRAREIEDDREMRRRLMVWICGIEEQRGGR